MRDPCEDGTCDCDVSATLEEAVRRALARSKALGPDEEDGDCYLCRCSAGVDGPCPDCYVVRAGDPRSVEEIVAAWQAQA